MAESPVSYSGVPSANMAIPVPSNQPFPETVAPSVSTQPFPVSASAPSTGDAMKNALAMQPYMDKSFVVVGDSRPFRESLKQLGGRWKKFLKGADGQTFRAWVFGLSHQDEVKDFVERVNRGEVEPEKFERYQRRPKYQNGQGQQGFRQPIYSNPAQAYAPAHGPVHASTHAYAGMPPSLQGQYINPRGQMTTYHWPKPNVGMTCNVRADNVDYPCHVVAVNQHPKTGNLTSAIIAWPGGEQNRVAVVYNAYKDKFDWKVIGYDAKHSIRFF